MERLISWSTGKGARLTKLVPQPGSRQLVVSEDVEAGDTLIAVPQELLLHADCAFEDAEYKAAFRQLGSELRATNPTLDDRHFLCLLLILEKARQGDSAWDPYISILPEEYDDPYWWHEDQIQLLKGTRLSRAIATHQQGLQSITSSLLRLEQIFSAGRQDGSAPSVLRTYQGGWALKLQAARWARSAVWSRSFTVRQMSSGARNVVAMVPVLDMIDHSPGMEVVWHTGRDGTEPFQFTPLSAVKKGAVMSNNYGRKSSDELLLAYGFLLDGRNPADHVVVSLAHSRMTPQQHTADGTQLLIRQHDGSGAGQGPMVVEDVGDGGDEDQAAQQQAAEDLQRALALAGLGLAVDQQLSAADPLPQPLLLGAQLCLLPVPQLYVWIARLQRSGPGRSSVPASQPGSNGDAFSTQGAVHGVFSGHKRSWQQAQPDGVIAGASSSTSSFPAAVSALLSADTAMHIEPAQPTTTNHHHHGDRDTKHGFDHTWRSKNQGDGHSSGRGWSHPQVHLMYRLQALVSMKQQLQSRLAGMASDRHVQAAHAHALTDHATRAHVTLPPLPCSPHAACPAAPASSADTPSCSNHHTNHSSDLEHSLPPEAEWPNGSAHHSGLAAAYVGVQKSLLRQSLHCMASHVSSQLHAASEVLQRTLDDRLIACSTLQEAASTSQSIVLLPPVQQQQEGSSTWSSIDPDVHVRQYVGWLHSHAIHAQEPSTVPSLNQQGGGTEAWQPESLHQSHTNNQPQNASPLQQQQQQQGNGQPAGLCLLQEVVYRRCIPTAFASRRSSREGSMNSLGMNSVGASAAAPTQPQPTAAAAKPANGRTRAPPSASRTFTMKGVKPNSLAAAGAQASTPAAPPPPQQKQQPVCKRVSLPQGLGASVGVDSDHDPMAVGVSVSRHVPEGAVVAQVPLQCCLTAATKQKLICALMSSANRVLHALLAAIRPFMATPQGQAGGQAGASSASGDAAGMAAAAVVLSGAKCDMLTWHLMHCVSSAPSARLMSDVEGVQLLSEMLEDSPAGGAYQEAYDALKEQFVHLRKAAALNVGANAALSKTDLLLRLLALPSAYHLFTWAHHVVERCALQITNPGVPETSWVLAPVLCSIPAVLREALLVAETVQAPSSASSVNAVTGPTVAGDASIVAGAAVAGSLVVRAACELREGLQLSPLVLLPGQDIEEVMLEWGPEALPWQHLLHSSATRHMAVRATSAALERTTSVTQPTSCTNGVATARISDAANAANSTLSGGETQAFTGGRLAGTTSGLLSAAAVGLLGRCSGSGSGSGHASLLAAAGFGPTVLYELYVCPGERDQHCYHKLLLLAAAGLGCVHYLTEDLSTEHLVMCALKICLAGQGLLKHPLMQSCLSLHSKWRQESLASPPSTGNSNAPSTWLASACNDMPMPHDHADQATPQSDLASAAASASSVVNGATGNAGSGKGGLHALSEAQSQLFAMLHELPDDDPVCRAARKQLRQMVHDARKNTRRRLKQLEAVHNVVASHMSAAAAASATASSLSNGTSSGVGRNGTYGVVGVLGGSYNSLGGSTTMHDGVRLYLAGVCNVLDTWADHLGLNRQSDSMSKRHKSRHDDV